MYPTWPELFVHAEEVFLRYCIPYPFDRLAAKEVRRVTAVDQKKPVLVQASLRGGFAEADQEAPVAAVACLGATAEDCTGRH